MRNPRSPAFWLVFSLGGVGFLAAHALAADWAYWRGPEQNGVARDRGLPASWSLDPKDKNNNLLWSAPYSCRSTPIVMNGRVYLNNGVDQGVNEQERVLCLNADTGKLVWERRFNVWHTDIVSVRLGWTNLCADPKTDRIYWHGTQGFLVCFDGKTGKTIWEHSLTEEYGRVSGYGGRLTSPAVDENLVIFSMNNSSYGNHGKGGNRFVAFDKNDGTPVWWSEPAERPLNTYQSNPIFTVIDGQRLMISGGSDGALHALQPRTGKKVWSYKFAGNAIFTTPVADGKYIYACHGEENFELDNNEQGRILCLDASVVKDGKPKLVWQVDGIKLRYASPIVHESRVYASDEIARLYCFDAKTGKQLWRRPHTYGRDANGSPVWADGKIYVADVNSKFHILEPGPDRCKILHEQFFPSADGITDVEIYSTPAIADGRIYLSTTEATYCIGKKGEKSKTDPIPPLPAESKAGAPAQVLVVPAEVQIQPGQSVQFSVRVFDANGRRLDAKAPAGKWSLPTLPPPPPIKVGTPPLVGTVTPDGKLTVSKDIPAQGGCVQFQCAYGTALARVRVTPALTYSENFDKLPVGAVPAGWVNTSGKFYVKKLPDGNHVLAKVNTSASPLLARANAYFGAPAMTDYTIEADGKGIQLPQSAKAADPKAERDLPDMGLVANRYALILVGNTQSLRLVSWDAMPRIDATVGFSWKPDVWYSMKLTVSTSGGKAIARGKVWERGKPEPSEWSVAVTDPKPNTEGSPALYAYVTDVAGAEPGTDVYLDNLRLTPNKK